MLGVVKDKKILISRISNKCSYLIMLLEYFNFENKIITEDKEVVLLVVSKGEFSQCYTSNLQNLNLCTCPLGVIAY